MPALRRYLLKRIVILAAAAGRNCPSAPLYLSPVRSPRRSGSRSRRAGRRTAAPPGTARAAGPGWAGGAGFIRILGLPPSFSLNRGFAAVGAWAVSAGDADGLTLTAPGDFEGNLLLTIELVRGQNAEPLRWQVLIALAQKRSGNSQPPTPIAGTMPGAPGGPPKPPESIGSMKAAQPLRAASRAQMNRAKELLQNNDIAAARLIFKRLAETGLAEAAFNLAQTYDPDFLKTIPTAGLERDPALARQWYERAVAMGDAAAASRISELNAR